MSCDYDDKYTELNHSNEEVEEERNGEECSMFARMMGNNVMGILRYGQQLIKIVRNTRRS